jgi:hypothetical protein
MTAFHTHFDTPAGEPHDLTGCPGHDKLREYWQQHHDDAPAVKPQRDVVANNRRAGARHNRAQDEYYNGLVLLAWQMVKMDGLSMTAACAEVGIARGTYTKRVGRLKLEPVGVD